ncbi:MAG: ester cyclase [Polyangiaceae bacterium]
MSSLSPPFETVKRLHAELVTRTLTQRRLDDLSAFFTADHKLACELLPAGDWSGPVGFSRFVSLVLQKLGSPMPTVLAQFATHDKCVTHLSVLAMHTGQLGPIQPTRRWPTVRAVLYSELRDGKLSATWVQTDALAVLSRNYAWRVADQARGGSAEVFDDPG